MDLLEETAHDILAAADPWPALVQAGLPLVGLPEEYGGSGGTFAEFTTVLRVAAYHAAPVPLAETWLAGWLLAAARRPIPAGRLTVATGPRVPFAETADHLVAVTGATIGLYARAEVTVEPGRNLAGEPRDSIALPRPGTISSPLRIADVRLRGALLRAVQIAGASRRVLEESLRYAGEREQFGRPIAKFQAVQHLLAELAGEVAVTDVSVRAAVGAATREAAMAAKANASRSAGTVARIAHQIHGAIGVTEEHPLHTLTQRLWSWREEYGGAAYWEARLGEETTDLWLTVTG